MYRKSIAKSWGIYNLHNRPLNTVLENVYKLSSSLIFVELAIEIAQ